MKRIFLARAVPLAALAVVLFGCSSVTNVTRERVARSETSVQQAQQTIGSSEVGALELQRARGNLEHARRAMDDMDGPAAERFAQQAELDAELAVAKAQSARARRAADELQASIRMLREEAGLHPHKTQVPRSEMTPPEDDE